MEKCGISKLDLKRRNRMQILRVIKELGPISRVDVASALEITRAAVTIITNEMIEEGVLVELGEVQKLTFGDGKDHFDADTSLHYHFVCRSCGAVIDLPMEPLSDIDQKAQACTAGQVEDHTVFFFGRCADCCRKNQH